MTLDLLESRIQNPPASKTTKTKPKNLTRLHFVNKGMDIINITKIINNKNVKKNLPTQFNKTEQILAVNALKQYGVRYLTIDTKDILYNMKNLPCNCTTSPLTDRNNGHIVTGDIRILQNNKLRKYYKYKEFASINFSNCKTERKIALQNFLLTG